MAKDKEEDDKDDGLVIVTDDAKNLDVPALSEADDDEDLPPKKAKGAFADDEDDDEDKPEPKGKKAAAKEEDDEDEDTEDKRLGASEETEAEEEAKQKDRATHKSRRQKRKEAEQKLRNENRFYQLRNEKLEKQVQDLAKRQDKTEKSDLEKSISNHKALIRKAESVMADAVTNSKGEELAEATRIRDNLRDQLKEFETRVAEEPETDQEERVPPNPQVVVRAQNFVKANQWYDFKRGDQDSRIAGAIDDSLWAEGYDPATDEYWTELGKRIAKALPHRAPKKKAANGHDTDDEDVDEDEDERPTPKKKRKDSTTTRAGNGGPKFRTGGPGRDLKANEVYLSRNRIEAMKEAGVWDDPVQREKHLKRYREWDRENAHLYK